MSHPLSCLPCIKSQPVRGRQVTSDKHKTLLKTESGEVETQFGAQGIEDPSESQILNQVVVQLDEIKQKVVQLDEIQEKLDGHRCQPLWNCGEMPTAANWVSFIAAVVTVLGVFLGAYFILSGKFDTLATSVSKLEFAWDRLEKAGFGKTSNNLDSNNVTNKINNLDIKVKQLTRALGNRNVQVLKYTY